MKKNDIEDIVITILIEKYYVPFDSPIIINKSISIFNNTVVNYALNLVYLFFELEKEFNIRFTYEELLDYQFTTIDGISALIERKVKKPCS